MAPSFHAYLSRQIIDSQIYNTNTNRSSGETAAVVVVASILNDKTKTVSTTTTTTTRFKYDKHKKMRNSEAVVVFRTLFCVSLDEHI